MTSKRGKKPRRRPAEPVEAPSAKPWTERRFPLALAILLAVAAIIRLVQLFDYTASNPLAGTPINDAVTYWDWAARIAGGDLGEDSPFFSDPLYPYLVGLVRAVGGGLTTVYFLQQVVTLLTGAVLAIVARRRLGAASGLVAAGLFLFLLDPASASLRVLPTAVQMLLVTVTWAALLRLQTRPTVRRALAAGAAMGLLCLSYAPALLLFALVPVWMLLQRGGERPRLVPALIPTVAALVVVSPATIHNLQASGELFLVRAGGGITLRQGNAPGSRGAYTPVEGVSTLRDRMHHDVRAVVREAAGHEPTWREADRHFRNQVLQDWSREPVRAVRLAVTKLYWFLTGRGYADIYQPSAEISAGLSASFLLTPLPVAWLMGPALVGVVLMLRAPVRWGPELMLVILPALVVTVFFYSPRYRAPAIPIICFTAVWAVAGALPFRTHPIRAAAVLGSLALALILGPINRAAGFDLSHPAALAAHVAHAHTEQGNREAAILWQRHGLELTPEDTEARVRLAQLLTESGRAEEAWTLLEEGRALGHETAGLLHEMGVIRFSAGDPAGAEKLFAEAVALQPDDPILLAKLAGTKQVLKKTDEALAVYEQAVNLAPRQVPILEVYAEALLIGQRVNDAVRVFETIVELDPDHLGARRRLGLIFLNARQYDRAVEHLEQAVRIRPDDEQSRRLLQQARQGQGG